MAFSKSTVKKITRIANTRASKVNSKRPTGVQNERKKLMKNK